MNEKTKKILSAIVVLIVFIISVSLVVIGQRHVGLWGLGIMLAGLAGLVVLLWLYNRQYK